MVAPRGEELGEAFGASSPESHSKGAFVDAPRGNGRRSRTMVFSSKFEMRCGSQGQNAFQNVRAEEVHAQSPGREEKARQNDTESCVSWLTGHANGECE